MVSPMVVRDMSAMLQSNRDASFVFRRLMTVLIPQIEDWTTSVGSQGIMERFRDQVSAAYGKRI